MTSLFKLNHSPVVHNRLWRFHWIRKVSLCKNQIKLCKVLVAVDNAVGKLACICGKLKENSFNLLLFLWLQKLDVIVCLNNAHRLNKHGCTAWRGVVYKTRNIASAFTSYGNNISAVTLCDDSILKILYVCWAVNNFIEYLTSLWGGCADFSSYIRQNRACLIGNFLLAYNSRGDFVLKKLVGNKSAEIAVKRACSSAWAWVPLLDRADCSERWCNRQKFACGKATACLCSA